MCRHVQPALARMCEFFLTSICDPDPLWGRRHMNRPGAIGIDLHGLDDDTVEAEQH